MFRSRNLKRRTNSLFVRREGEFAAAVVLVVDVVFADETVTAILKAAFPPIFAPPSHSGCRLDGFKTKGLTVSCGGGVVPQDFRIDNRAGVAAGGINLREAFPSGRSQGGRQHRVVVGCSIAGRPQQTELETFPAARSPFRFLLKTLDSGTPGAVIIFILHHFQAPKCRIADQLRFAVLIFLERKNVGIAEENAGTQARAEHPLQDGRRAGRATAVKQDADILQIRQRIRFEHIT